MFKLNNTNIFTGYIKELLHSTNIPTIDVYKEGTQVFNNNYYIKDNNIVYINSNGLMEIVKTYHDNEEILVPKVLTRHLEITNNIYDADTHFMLGKYLRWLKSYHKINLMSLYNCFCKNMPINLNINFNDNNKNIIFSSDDSSYVIYMFPVSLNEKYTIAMDCDLPVEITCGYFDAFKMDNQELDVMYGRTYKKIAGLKFNAPVLYDKLSSLTGINEISYRNRDKLKMFLKVPVSCTSSIVVLEGDYTSANNRVLYTGNTGIINQQYKKTIVNLEDNDNMIWDALDNETFDSSKLSSPLQLLKMNDGQSYCFSDRLVEYLIGNTIDKLDTISDNIKRIQYVIRQRFPGNSFSAFTRDWGIWSDKLQCIIYSYATSGETHFDSLGYVDKDVEGKFGNDIDIYKGVDSL